ncbi:MAG: CHAT domain-containing protein [Caldilineaceae bacterium]
MVGSISILGNDLLCETADGGPGASVRIPLTDALIIQWQQWTIEYRRAVRTNDPPALFALGQALFTWLDQARWATEWTKGTGPRVLEIAVDETDSPAATALLDLPWEIMAQGQDFLAGDGAQPFVLYRSIGRQRTSTPAPPAYRDLAALFMAASPRGQQELDYEAEEAAILRATERLPMQLVVEESGCGDFFKERLAQEGSFEAIHLSCHGDILRDGEAALALESPEGELALTRPGPFATLLGERKATLVFLSACRTAESHQNGAAAVSEPFVRALIRAGVANALGWDGSVYDTDAIRFARAFYGEVANHATIPFAAAQARQAVLRAHREDPKQGRHWHRARVYIGPTGGGACCDRGRPRRPARLRRDAGFHEFLDKANGRVPVATAQEFVGRRREAQQVLRAFRAGEAAGVLLFGMGHLGKSSLAARVANRLPRHQTVVVYDRYDAPAIFDQLLQALPGRERQEWAQTWRQAILDDHALLADALEELLEGPFDQEPILLIIDDLEQVLAQPQPNQRLTPVQDAPGRRDAWRTSLAALLRAFATADTPSRLVNSSRYRFTLADGRGRDLADSLLPVQLRPMDARARAKQWRAARRGEAARRARLTAPQTEADAMLEELAGEAQRVAGGNPGLQAILCRPLLAGEAEAAAAAIDTVERWKQTGKAPTEASAAQEFFQRLALATYEGALTAEQRTQLRAATLFGENLPVPLPALAAAGHALGVPDPAPALLRLTGLGLVDDWGEQEGGAHAAANPLARPLAGAPLTAPEQARLAQAVLAPLAQSWRAGEGDFPYDPRGVEAARLALAGRANAALLEAAAYPAGYHLYYTEHNATAALALLQPALAQLTAQGAAPRPRFFRLAADCAKRIGETGLQIALLEQGLALESDDRRGMTQLVIVHAEATLTRDGPDEALTRLRDAATVFAELGDVRERAVTMGQIADILQQRGESDEALRIRREEQLPVYERLGDVRERAVTMGQIADILQQRGESDEALRIYLEECLPVLQRIQDLDSLAHVRYFCANIRLQRGGLQGDEGQTIIDELGESFALFRKLQRVDGIAFVGSLFGQVLAAVGLRDEAMTVLDDAAAAFDRLQQPAQAAQLRALQARLRGAAE